MSVLCSIITNYSQQDATFLEFIYFYRRSACFRRFLRPSSGAHAVYTVLAAVLVMYTILNKKAELIAFSELSYHNLNVTCSLIKHFN